MSQSIVTLSIEADPSTFEERTGSRVSKHTAKSRHTPEMLEDELLQDELNNDVVPLHRCKSLISLLMSTTLHLMTLAVLTLILVGVDEDLSLIHI